MGLPAQLGKEFFLTHKIIEYNTPVVNACLVTGRYQPLAVFPARHPFANTAIYVEVSFENGKHLFELALEQ